MNSKLELTGDVSLIDPIFNFVTSRWNIVEGNVDRDIAFQNNLNLEKLFETVKKMKGNVFKIDNLDAFFDVSRVTSTTADQNFYPSLEAVSVPSDFTLEMTNNTYLRVFPNSRKSYVLLGIREKENVTVRGGNIIGDRDDHDYNGGTHEWGFCLMIHGSSNVVIDGVTTSLGTGDGIDINSLNHSFQPNYIPSHTIKVINCVLDNNRRNNMSITDGNNILVENNTFLNASRSTANSEGVAPGFAIDVEAFRKRENGVLVLFEKAFDITIRNNVEKNSRKGAIIIAIGDHIDIENNTTQGGISIGAGHHINIINNTLIADKSNTSVDAGVVTGHPVVVDTYNNVVSGNTIKGFNIAVAAYQRDTKVFNNKFEDFDVGILPKDISNFEIYNNTFKSSREISTAIFASLTSMNNVKIYNHKNLNNEPSFQVTREDLKFVSVNQKSGEENNKVYIENNDFGGHSTISRTKGLQFTGNKTKGGLAILNSQNINIMDNEIISNDRDGIKIDSSSNLDIERNSIQTNNTRFECIKELGTSANVNLLNNTCL